MKRIGLKKNKARLLLAGLIMLALLAMGGSHSGVPQVQPAAVNGSTSGNVNSTLYAYVVGIPTVQNPFGGFAFPNVSSAMPPQVEFLIHSYGNSSVDISWSGANNAVTLSNWSWYVNVTHTFAAGTYLIEIVIYSLSLQTSISQTYTINVMNYTQYIQYENSLNPTKVSSYVPWYEVPMDVGIAGVLMGIFAVLSIWSVHIWYDNYEKKHKMFPVR